MNELSPVLEIAIILGVVFVLAVGLYFIIVGGDHVDDYFDDKKFGRNLSKTYPQEVLDQKPFLLQPDHRIYDKGIEFRPVAWGNGNNDTVVKYEEVME